MGSWNWPWQGVLRNGIYAILFTAGGVLMAWLKARQSRFAGPLLYGLAGVVCLSGLALSFEAHQFYSSQERDAINAKNAESTVKGWLASYGFGYTEPLALTPPAFAFDTLLLNGSHMLVARFKPSDQYLTIRATVQIDERSKEELAKSPTRKIARLNRDVAIELVRSKMIFNRVNIPSEEVSFEKHLAISASLNGEVLNEAMGEVNSAQTLVAYTIANEVNP